MGTWSPVGRHGLIDTAIPALSLPRITSLDEAGPVKQSLNLRSSSRDILEEEMKWDLTFCQGFSG